MSIYFKHYSEHNLCLAIFHGSVTDRELEDHISELLLDKYDGEGKLGLIVLCETASASKVSYQAIYSAGKRMQQVSFRKNGKLAIIAKNTLGFGLARIYQAVTEVTGLDETRVMRGDKLDVAVQWVGVSSLSEEIKQKINQLESGMDVKAC